MGNGIWVGVYDLSSEDPVTALSGPSGSDVSARILVKMHDAPVGYVTVPLNPVASLPTRVWTAAAAKLAGPLRRHERCSRDVPASCSDWAAQAACPRRFPAPSGTGLTVVICTRDRPTELRQSLQSILRATYEPIEALVVDNAPTGESTRHVVAAFAAADSRVRYVCEPAPGLSNARNRGLAAASYDLVAFTDDDVRVDPGWPAALVAGFALDPQGACVTGLVASRSLETAAERYFDARYPWGEAFEPRRFDMGENRDPSPAYPFVAGKFGTGANFAVRRSYVQELGGFDPLLGAGSPSRGGEDLDMFVRIIRSGARLSYLPAALSWHQHRSDYESLAEQLYDYGHGLGAYIAKRLMTREVSMAAMTAGVGRLNVLAGRARQASRTSQVNAGGQKRLALIEARGVAAGALRYRRLARRRRD